ncbi:MAG: exodeoxyribonuclease VII large subunit [Proteobacteria bacterium]|uniref:Exodeoxyribonuclease 7 large subunit n=1 Tax=Candidatus Enterousia excrementavium TaxID=2840789 RepID=A0A940IBW9_9PROT|nr:exodeoxyribonuclease VII large subunit [Candidatus Enterousia excrementavium]
MMEKPQPFVQPDTVFSVTDASALLKNVVETAFPRIRVRGELSQITRATSGHMYMTIKDAGAAISVIIWRGTPVPFKLEDGLEVIITGRFTTYPARSNYQIIVSEIEMAGVGAILKMLEERKRKLAAEGLFDQARKKPLPHLPQRIGVVTSPTGAAFQDIQNRLRERFPVTVVLYPATVQGTTAAAEVAAGIEYFNRAKNVDVIIVARGGGALEDLLPFSEEIVVRAAAASEIPLISGVGHEPDWMLIDYAADVRAPTPTGAAEMVVPTKLSLIQELDNLWHRLSNNFTTRLANARARMESIVVKNPKQLVMEQQQRLDDISRTLNVIINGKIVAARGRMDAVAAFPNILQNKMMVMTQGLNHLGQMLNSLSYKSVLSRGYAIVRDEKNQIISRADGARPALIEFADGVVKV